MDYENNASTWEPNFVDFNNEQTQQNDIAEILNHLDQISIQDYQFYFIKSFEIKINEHDSTKILLFSNFQDLQDLQVNEFKFHEIQNLKKINIGTDQQQCHIILKNKKVKEPDFAQLHCQLDFSDIKNNISHQKFKLNCYDSKYGTWQNIDSKIELAKNSEIRFSQIYQLWFTLQYEETKDSNGIDNQIKGTLIPRLNILEKKLEFNIPYKSGKEYIIGRGNDKSIIKFPKEAYQINDINIFENISRNQAFLSSKEGKLYIEDKCSKFGTWIKLKPNSSVSNEFGIPMLIGKGLLINIYQV